MSLKDNFLASWKSLEPKQKAMAIASSIVIVLCVAWMLIGALSGLFDARNTQNVRELPQQQIVELVNKELLADPRFADVGMAVEWGPPPKLVVNGGVHSAADLKSLTDRLKELRPEEDYELNVELLRK